MQPIFLLTFSCLLILLAPKTEAMTNTVDINKSPAWGLGQSMSMNFIETPKSIDKADLDTDGDLLTDVEELTLGTDPSNPDTDGDGFLDGEEHEANSNPLSNNSLPINPNLSLGESFAASFSVRNNTDPSGPAIGETFTLAVSIVNQANPTGQIYGEIYNLAYSILNESDPSQPSYGEVFNLAYSVLNQVDPTGKTYGETIALPFSTLNQSDPTEYSVQEVTGPVVSVKNSATTRVEDWNLY